MNVNLLDQFIEEIYSIEELSIPQSVIYRTKLALLDYLGVTFAGYYELRNQVKTIIESFCENDGKIFPVGISTPMSMNNAVFLNGLNAHVLDFDDGTNAGIIHLGSPIFSVLLAIAQKYDIRGEDLLKAAVIGYETSFTMARSIQPMHKKRGYHATATCGVLGIAMASAILLKFNKSQVKQALSVAALSATGSLKVLEDGSQLKPYNVGKTALLGLLSIQMANAGFIGPNDAFSGVAGFLNQMYGSEFVQFVPCLQDGTYAIEKAYIKPYAACRYTHPSIDVALELRRNSIVSVEDIASILIKTYSLAVKNHDHTEISCSASAKMSIPYNFAITYLTGKTGLEAFAPEMLSNQQVNKIINKIRVEEDARMTAAFPEKTIATVTITLNDGSIIEGTSILPKGEPENPLSEKEVFEKFSNLAIYGGKSIKDTEKIIDKVMNIEIELPTLLELIR